MDNSKEQNSAHSQRSETILSQMINFKNTIKWLVRSSKIQNDNCSSCNFYPQPNYTMYVHVHILCSLIRYQALYNYSLCIQLNQISIIGSSLPLIRPPIHCSEFTNRARSLLSQPRIYAVGMELQD